MRLPAPSLRPSPRQPCRLRGGLQQTGTRSAYLRFQQRCGTEWRYYDQYAHHVANSIKQEALRVRATHVAFENLTRIRKRLSNLLKFQQWLFKKVRKYTEYKLEQYGVTVDTTKPEYTSQLALISGTLSPTVEFAEHDWVSTDKPHPPRASGSSSARAK